MRNKIDTSNVRFRVEGFGPRQKSRLDKTQKTTGDRDPKGNRPIWSVRLTAYSTTEDGRKTSDQIFVEVAGPEPQLVVEELCVVENLTYDPWAAVEQGPDGKWRGKVMRAYRADSIVTPDASARRPAA
jgi:hypothetical protein